MRLCGRLCEGEMGGRVIVRTCRSLPAHFNRMTVACYNSGASDFLLTGGCNSPHSNRSSFPLSTLHD